MTAIEQTMLQLLSKWWYRVGVSRIQTRITLTAPVFFLWSKRPRSVFVLEPELRVTRQVPLDEEMHKIDDVGARMVQVGHRQLFLTGGRQRPN